MDSEFDELLDEIPSQEPPENNTQELDEGLGSAQKEETNLTPMDSSAEKQVVLENPIIRKLNKVDEYINRTFKSVNDIDREIKKCLQNAESLRQNRIKLKASLDHNELIDKLYDNIATFNGTLRAADGSLEDIKKTQERIQDMMEDIKERINEE